MGLCYILCMLQHFVRGAFSRHGAYFVFVKSGSIYIKPRPKRSSHNIEVHRNTHQTLLQCIDRRMESLASVRVRQTDTQRLLRALHSFARYRAEFGAVSQCVKFLLPLQGEPF